MKTEEETWVDWIIRVTKVARVAMEKAKVADWVREQKLRKWRWAGHVARRRDGRWTRRMLDWDPKGGSRRVGRPLARWEDSLVEFAKTTGEDWRKLAEDRVLWSSLEADYVAFKNQDS